MAPSLLWKALTCYRWRWITNRKNERQCSESVDEDWKSFRTCPTDGSIIIQTTPVCMYEGRRPFCGLELIVQEFFEKLFLMIFLGEITWTKTFCSSMCSSYIYRFFINHKKTHLFFALILVYNNFFAYTFRCSCQKKKQICHKIDNSRNVIDSASIKIVENEN